MTEIDMKGNPFFLDEEGENWVLDTWKNMSLEQKCGQVFCPMGFNGEEETLKHFTQDIPVSYTHLDVYKRQAASFREIITEVILPQAVRKKLP